MLTLQLRTTKKPVNYGDFTPRLAKTAPFTMPLKPHAPRVGSARDAAMSARDSEAGRDRQMRSKSSGGAARYKSCHTKLVQDQKALANGNSYQGTCLDRHMHGDGFYTWSDGSEYTGEFREGAVWGHGEKRWPNGRMYRGEWVRDMMWGDGEMTWPNGEIFKGQFRKGIFHGRGTRVWPNGDRYTGDFKNGDQDGEGVFESATGGWVYNGHWLNGRMCGEGRVRWPSGIEYVGDWVHGTREGAGRLTWLDGSAYEGQFKSNSIEGFGRKVLANGSWFEGHFKNGELEGNGMFHWADGTEFEGPWANSEIVGPGKHKFPDGTSITGIFRDGGASGDGSKQWPGGLSFVGSLHQNHIHRHGTLRWPDGRCYTGQFKDEAMHGEGTLTWSDKDGQCRYSGQFEHNLFHGNGLLDWSNKAHYTGQFEAGLYHGSGKFQWANGVTTFVGQWERGVMSGRGVLAYGDSLTTRAATRFVYTGEFKDGDMEGGGDVRFCLPDNSLEQYKGEFRASKFHGRGLYRWASGHSLIGVFEDNHCNTSGRKTYPTGEVYCGELLMDMEHGRGVLVSADCWVGGIWKKGACVQELCATYVPAFELDGIEGEEIQRVFGGIRDWEAIAASADGSSATAACPTSLPTQDQEGEPIEGQAVVLYMSGDKYVGQVKAGKRDGWGMYMYPDLTTYKGRWSDDTLDGVGHPLPMEQRTPQVLELHRRNEQNQEMAAELRVFPAAHVASTRTDHREKAAASKSKERRSVPNRDAGHA